MKRSVAVILLGVLGWGCEPREKPGKLDLDSLEVLVGTGGLVSKGRWNLVRVKARASEGVFKGWLRTRGRTDLDRVAPETFEREFAVAHEKQIFDVPVLIRDWYELTLSIQMSIDNRRGPVVASVPLNLFNALQPRCRLLLVSSVNLSANELQTEAADCLGVEMVEISHGRLRPQEMPEHHLGYDVADIVIVYQTALTDASPEAIAALGEWVRRGGTVVGVPGADWTGKAPDAVLDLFGLASRPRPRAGVDPQVDEAGSSYELDPRPGTMLYGSGPTVLLENRFGAGKSYVHGFSPSTGFLAANSSSNELRSGLRRRWRYVIEENATRVQPGRSDSLAAIEPAAMQALHWFAGFSYPSRLSVIVFVVGYLGVGFYVVGFVFRRFHRLEWTYAFTLVVAILATVGIYHFGLLSAIKERTVDEVTVATLHPGARVASAVRFLGIASPHRRTIPLEKESGAVPSQPQFEEAPEWKGMNGQQPELLPLSYEVFPTVEVPALTLYPNASRYLRLDEMIDLGGALDIGRTAEGDVRVDNRTSHDFRFYLIVSSDRRLADLGTCSAGASKVLAKRQGSTVESEEEQFPFPFQNRYGSGPRGRAQIEDTFRKDLVRSILDRAHSIEEKPRQADRPSYVLAQAQAPLGGETSLGRTRYALSYILCEVPGAAE